MKHNWMGGVPLPEDHRRDLLEARTNKDLQGVMREYGWYDSGRGKGGHTVYVNDNVIGIITLTTRGKASDPIPSYMYRQFKEFCAKDMPAEIAAGQNNNAKPNSHRHHHHK
jgi:hypothetical protein